MWRESGRAAGGVEGERTETAVAGESASSTTSDGATSGSKGEADDEGEGSEGEEGRHRAEERWVVVVEVTWGERRAAPQPTGDAIDGGVGFPPPGGSIDCTSTFPSTRRLRASSSEPCPAVAQVEAVGADSDCSCGEDWHCSAVVPAMAPTGPLLLRWWL